MSIILRLSGLFGVLLFGILFSVTLSSPEVIEKSAEGFVKFQIEKELREKYEITSQSDAASRAFDFAGKLGYEKEKIQEDIENELPKKIASVIASLCGYDCEKKKALAQSITSSYLERINKIEIAQNTLGGIIKGKYVEIVGSLKFDLRIFLGSNFMMFLILLSISFLKPQAITHLFLPGMLLLLATAVSSLIYIYGQNWFYTILYNDYMGFAYLAYIAFIFGGLLDIVFNKARILTEIINGVANAFGSAFSVSPC